MNRGVKMTKEQKQSMDKIKKLKTGWFDKKSGRHINQLAISMVERLLDKLPNDFEVFPLADGFIQIECTRDSKYLEIEIQESKFKVYWQLLKNGVVLSEGEDIFLCINDSVYTRISKFVDFFFNEL